MKPKIGDLIISKYDVDFCNNAGERQPLILTGVEGLTSRGGLLLKFGDDISDWAYSNDCIVISAPISKLERIIYGI